MSLYGNLKYETHMDEEDQNLIEVAVVGPRLHVEAKLLLKVTTKANLRGEGEQGGSGEKRGGGSGGNRLEGERGGEWGSRGEQGRKEEEGRGDEGRRGEEERTRGVKWGESRGREKREKRSMCIVGTV